MHQLPWKRTKSRTTSVSQGPHISCNVSTHHQLLSSMWQCRSQDSYRRVYEYIPISDRCTTRRWRLIDKWRWRNDEVSQILWDKGKKCWELNLLFAAIWWAYSTGQSGWLTMASNPCKCVMNIKPRSPRLLARSWTEWNYKKTERINCFRDYLLH